MTSSLTTSSSGLRVTLAGLVGFAATQEQVLLAADGGTEAGDPDRWAAVPLVVHNTGHLGEYYLSHGLADRAVMLAEHAVTTAVVLDAPAPARGMASYNLACALTGAGQLSNAAAAAAQAIGDNADLRANAARGPDLADVRDRDELRTLLAD